MANLYIGDWHYGHKNILAIDNRPFKTIEEVNNPHRLASEGAW